MFIDTHSHIYGEEFKDERKEVVERAKAAGVERIILPDIDETTRSAMLELSEEYPGMMFPTIGLHPTSVNEDYKTELKKVEKALGEHRFYGIGECGIDLYWDKTYYKEQFHAFSYQLGLAKETNLPVIIHSRDSLNEIFKALKPYPYIKGVFHCFPGNAEEARRVIGDGFMLGIGGVVTFKNSPMAQVVQEVGIGSLLLETDSPYLTPVPHRGKRNESAYIPIIAQKIAELTQTDLKKVQEVTSQNAMNLFTL
ncbi:TatD family hydrolase [Odoribacter lunatus]|uniref:TatD family hydrolase n=1 Tax=Odoribacter lunatus TaxID=2941335 RepID=UPI00203EC03A|nr:TatD family hydrolase [Odoribacter lunatus]